MGSRHRDIFPNGSSFGLTACPKENMFAVFAFCPIGTTAREKISEEARFLKALELSYKEVYDLEEML